MYNESGHKFQLKGCVERKTEVAFDKLLHVYVSF